MATYCVSEYVALPLPTQPVNVRDRLCEGGEHVQVLGKTEYLEWYGVYIHVANQDNWVNRHFKKVSDETWEARDYAGYFVNEGDILQIRRDGRHSMWVDIQVIASKKT